VENSRTAAASQ